MINKYYTPEIGEFHVGFQYQRNDGGVWYNNTSDAYDMMSVQTQLNKSNFNKGEYINYRKFNKRIRVKYLDREDIESLGFTQSKSDINWYDYKNNRYWLYREDNKDWRWIISDEQSEVSFAGNIKNKAELKVLLKQLNIK